MLALSVTALAEEKEIVHSVRSPNGSLEAESGIRAYLDSTKGRVTVRHQGKEIFDRTYGPERELRYLKLSWSPSSGALLIGDNYKYGMDLAVIRFSPREGRATGATNFPLTDRMHRVIEVHTAWRDELKSHAPVGRVVWDTVKWVSNTRSTMTYIFHGLGREAAADVTVDLSGAEPKLIINNVRPRVPAGLFEVDRE